MTKRTVCILGCGGFIGSHLVDRLIASGDYHVIGVDKVSGKIVPYLDHPRFTFAQLDVHDTKALRSLLERSEAVFSLVGLCNPSLYNKIPLDVIDVNFMRPLEVVKLCVELDKWLIQFSTCEVYGKTVEHLTGSARGTRKHPEYRVLNEDTTPMILGAVGAQRWSYACAKQLLERTIYAYGFEKGLRYTIVRPFNFIGPRMDYIPGVDGEGVPRVLACFMAALMDNRPLRLVDGGRSLRSFTYIGDAVDALAAMVAGPEVAQGQIFNVGNPDNEISIAGLADVMIRLYKELHGPDGEQLYQVEHVSGKEFYGEGYEDSDRRIPDIEKARRLLGWSPRTGLEKALRLTMRAYLDQYGQPSALREAS